MKDNLTSTPFEWKQYQIDVCICGVVSLLYALIFFGYYIKSRNRVHLILAASTFLEAFTSFLYAFAKPLCDQPGQWAVFVEGQLERLSEIGAFVLYLLFVISRLAYFDTLLPGIQKWAKPLQVGFILFLIAHLILQFVFDFATYSGDALPSDSITATLYLLFMLYAFITNFSINYIIAKCYIKHALEYNKDKELEKKCKRLRFLVYCSIITTLVGSILFNITFDYNDLALFHSMNILAILALTAHFYFEWMYQVLLTNIIHSKRLDLPSTQSQTAVISIPH